MTSNQFPEISNLRTFNCSSAVEKRGIGHLDDPYGRASLAYGQLPRLLARGDMKGDSIAFESQMYEDDRTRH